MKAYYLVLIIATMANCVILSRALGNTSWFGSAGRPSVAALFIVTSAVLLFLGGSFARLSMAIAGSWSSISLHEWLAPALAAIAVLLLVLPACALVSARFPLQYLQFRRLLPVMVITAAVLSAMLVSVQQPLLMSIVWLDAGAALFILLMMGFGGIRVRLNSPDVPATFRGLPAELICTGITALVLLSPVALRPAGAG